MRKEELGEVATSRWLNGGQYSIHLWIGSLAKVLVRFEDGCGWRWIMKIGVS